MIIVSEGTKGGSLNWAALKVGLYHHEERLFFPILVSSFVWLASKQQINVDKCLVKCLCKKKKKKNQGNLE